MTSARAEKPPSQQAESVGARVRVPWLLRRVSHRYRSAIALRLAECGLNDLPQRGYWAITVLARGASEASQLMEEMVLSKQAISKLVDVLVTSGFVIRKPNAADRRRTALLLSAKGRRAAGVIGEATRETEETFIAELGEPQFASFVEMLAHLGSRPSG